MSERVVFAGSKLPEGVTSWRLFDGNNERCFAPNEEGAQVSEFPVAALTVETIRSVWGPGVYRIQFLREKGGKRAPAGSRVLKVDPIAEVAPPPPAPPSPPVSAMDDPMARAFQIVDAIDRRAAVQAEKDREFLRAVLAVRAEPAPVAGGEILSAIQAIRGELASLRARVDGASFEDDDDDDDDDDQGDDDEPRGRLFRPGEPIKDTIVAEALNEIATFAKDLAPAAKMFIGAKLDQMASELKAPAPPASVPPPALNGAAPSVPPPPPVASSEAVAS